MMPEGTEPTLSIRSALVTLRMRMEFSHATKTTMFGDQRLDVGVDGGRLDEDREAGAVGDDFHVDLVRRKASEQVADVTEGEIPVGLVAGGEREKHVVGLPCARLRAGGKRGDREQQCEGGQ